MDYEWKVGRCFDLCRSQNLTVIGMQAVRRINQNKRPKPQIVRRKAWRMNFITHRVTTVSGKGEQRKRTRPNGKGEISCQITLIKRSQRCRITTDSHRTISLNQYDCNSVYQKANGYERFRFDTKTRWPMVEIIYRRQVLRVLARNSPIYKEVSL